MRTAPWLRRTVAALPIPLLALMTISAPAQAAPKKRDVPCRNGYVSISFDDGPTPSTPALLTALGKADLRATFFDVGHQAERFPNHVRAESLLGHVVANHSYDHPDLVALGHDGTVDQLTRTQAILTGLTGRAPTLFRPPYGSTNDDVEAVAAGLGLTEVIWTVDTRDWDGPSTAEIVQSALTVQAGGFVLMHDGYPNTVAAVPRIAAGLADRGLCAGRIVPSAVPTHAWYGVDFDATVAPW